MNWASVLGHTLNYFFWNMLGYSNIIWRTFFEVGDLSMKIHTSHVWILLSIIFVLYIIFWSHFLSHFVTKTTSPWKSVTNYHVALIGHIEYPCIVWEKTMQAIICQHLLATIRCWWTLYVCMETIDVCIHYRVRPSMPDLPAAAVIHATIEHWYKKKNNQ